MVTQTMAPRPAARELTAELQALLVDLIALSLEAKQAHWNLTGPLFSSLHERLDEFTAQYRAWADAVAERMRALGEVPDGRPARVADARIAALPAGLVADQDVLRVLIEALEEVSGRLREQLPRMGELDPSTQDLVIDVVRGLEQQAWMLRATRG